MKHVLSFYGTVSASSRNTLVSQQIRFPYVIDHIRVKFALGHEAKVQHKFFVSDDPVVVTSGEPTGLNILKQWGSVDYVVGDDDVLDMEDNTIVDRMGTWIKVFAINTDTVDHTVNVIVTIEDMRVHPRMLSLIDILKEHNVPVIPNIEGVTET